MATKILAQEMEPTMEMETRAIMLATRTAMETLEMRMEMPTAMVILKKINLRMSFLNLNLSYLRFILYCSEQWRLQWKWKRKCEHW